MCAHTYRFERPIAIARDLNIDRPIVGAVAGVTSGRSGRLWCNTSCPFPVNMTTVISSDPATIETAPHADRSLCRCGSSLAAITTQRVGQQASSTFSYRSTETVISRALIPARSNRFFVSRSPGSDSPSSVDAPAIRA